MGRLDNKVAIVTGAGSGMGRSIARLFAAEGARVVAADVVDRNGQETVALIGQEGGTAHFVHADVSRAADVENLVQSAVATFGHLDIMVNNAGIEGSEAGRDIAENSLENFDAIISVNLKGVFLGMKYAIPELLRNGGGAIVNTASRAGLRGVPGLAIYSASKGGVVQMTKAAAIEYGTRNIRVNCVCPGYIVTSMTDRLAAQRTAQGEPERDFTTLNPMQRPGTPDEIAQAVLYLASDASGFVTGTALVVDGGSAAR